MAPSKDQPSTQEQISDYVQLALPLLEIILKAGGRLQWLLERPSAKLSIEDKQHINDELATARKRLDDALAKAL